MYESQKAMVKALDGGASHSEAKDVYRQNMKDNIPFGNLPDETVKYLLRDATPFEDLYGVVTGKDFDGNQYNRGEAGVWTAVSFIPFGKVVGVGGRVFLKGFAKTELKWGSRVFKNADEFRDAVKNAPDKIKAYESAAEQIAEKNGWKFNSSLSKKNKSQSGRNRKIYTNEKGEHFSLDTKTGSFEVHNKIGKQQGEMNFDGERKDPPSKGHDLKVK